MILKKWEDLPDFMRIPEVNPYYDILKKKRSSLFFKRVFDIVAGIIMLVILSPVFLFLAIAIKVDSKGPIFYRQVRVTQYGKEFRIHKFRTMCDGADKKGTLVTVGNDNRITRVGKVIRRFRIDEISQLLDVIGGHMSFVGTRPEAVKYVKQYMPEFNATLLLPAGVTSETSIRYKDEDKLLNAAADVEKTYLEDVLPQKMRWNLHSLSTFGFFSDFVTLFRTVLVVFGKEYDSSFEEVEDFTEKGEINCQGKLYKYVNNKFKELWFKLVYKDLFYYKNKNEKVHRGMHNLSGLFLQAQGLKEIDGRKMYCVHI